MTTKLENGTTTKIHSKTAVETVHLTVRDLDHALDFYQEALGMRVHWRSDDHAGLGAGKDGEQDATDILRLTGDPMARRVSRTAGLYHFAVLMPSRRDLARSLLRLVQTGTQLQGAADHWFSEAIYLADPEGNGIELYRDRERHEWPPMEEVARLGNGPFDLRKLLSEVESDTADALDLHSHTRLGHIHLRVSDISASDAFYTGMLGFDKMMDYGNSAGFVSAGGYHHHIAYNVWEGRGIAAAPEGAAGLRDFTIALPDEPALRQVLERLRLGGFPMAETAEGFVVRDPSGIKIVLRHA